MSRAGRHPAQRLARPALSTPIGKHTASPIAQDPAHLLAGSRPALPRRAPPLRTCAWPRRRAAAPLRAAPHCRSSRQPTSSGRQGGGRGMQERTTTTQHPHKLRPRFPAAAAAPTDRCTAALNASGGCAEAAPRVAGDSSSIGQCRASMRVVAESTAATTTHHEHSQGRPQRRVPGQRRPNSGANGAHWRAAAELGPGHGGSVARLSCLPGWTDADSAIPGKRAPSTPPPPPTQLRTRRSMQRSASGYSSAWMPSVGATTCISTRRRRCTRQWPLSPASKAVPCRPPWFGGFPPPAARRTLIPPHALLGSISA